MTQYQDPTNNVWYSYGATATVIAYVSGPTISGPITIPSTINPAGSDIDVTSIDDSALFNESAVTSIVVANSVTTIGKFAFSTCISLVSVTLPNAITALPSALFSDCFNLASITIPESVTSIGTIAPPTTTGTFNNCSSLISIVIPESVVVIGDRCCNGCTGLTSVVLGTNPSLETIGESAFEQTSLTSVPIPKGVASLGDGCFGDNTTLETVFFYADSPLTEIPESAFASTGIVSIGIPNAINSIGFDSFAALTPLGTVYMAQETLTALGLTAGSGMVFYGAFDVTIIVYDNVEPTMIISSSSISSGSATDKSSITLTFTSNKPTTNFTAADITADNGTIDRFTGSGTTYTARLTVEAQEHCSVVVPSGVFTDVAGFLNAESNTFVHNNIHPSMTIVSPGAASGSTVHVRDVHLRFISSSPTTDFSSSSIFVLGGTIFDFRSISSEVYTAVLRITVNCSTSYVWVNEGVYTDDSGNTNLKSTVYNVTFISPCPIPPILPTGVLAPSSGNISAKMRQAQRIKYSTAHGGMRYVSNRPIVDTLIRPIGQIYYAKYITFYYYAKALTISQFLSTIPWSSYGNTVAQALQFATIYLTMLFNVQRRLSAELVLPYYRTSTYVYYLKYIDGCIINFNQTGGKFSGLELTGSSKYFFIFNNLS